MRLGKEPKGIFAAGYATSEVYTAAHWDTSVTDSAKQANYVDFTFEYLFDPENEGLIDLDQLSSADVSDSFDWTPQASGVHIPDALAEKLEHRWSKLLDNLKVSEESEMSGFDAQKLIYREGRRYKVELTKTRAKQEGSTTVHSTSRLLLSCLSVRFRACIWSDRSRLDSSSSRTPFGQIPHRLSLSIPRPISSPLCANCHMVIHSKIPPYSVGELTEIMQHVFE